MTSPDSVSFSELSLSPAVLQALESTGYERPSPIQARTIPLLLAGKDVIGQAQTGTGKTAAFALPILSKIDLSQKEPQALILTPTRELALQVAEAFETYGLEIRGLHVLAVYGGTDFKNQLQGLRRGAHVVVGTPGRVMDHMRRGTLTLGALKTLVLDEADEMLRMGFIDDVQWILEQTPPQRQIALFSATMPPPIRKIAQQHLREPEQISIELKNISAETIRQRYWPVRGLSKLDALTRLLEAEDFSATLIFVRTKAMAVDLTDKLVARGFSASSLNGDMSQQMRESTVEKLRNGKLDIVVATDVAARGLDVDRISHVINYDMPQDAETYVHRIGRTGRAGREGDAVLFVSPREQRMLSIIERVTRKKIALLELPSVDVINERRSERFMARIKSTLETSDVSDCLALVERFRREHQTSMEEIAAALAFMAQGPQAQLPEVKAEKPQRERQGGDRFKARDDDSASFRKEGRRSPFGSAEEEFKPRKRREKDEFPAALAPREKSARREEPAAERFADKPRRQRFEEGREAAYQDKPRRENRERSERSPVPPPDLLGPSERGMERFRIAVGHADNVKPNNIVGAIANEAGISSKHIGRITIYDDFSLIDLPEGMPPKIFKHLQKVWVANKQLNISRFEGEAAGGVEPAKKPFKRKPKQ